MSFPLSHTFAGIRPADVAAFGVMRASVCACPDIAEKLYITEDTVKNHVSNILAKLQAENRTRAADIARRYGLV